jgi:hypothetical protein
MLGEHLHSFVLKIMFFGIFSSFSPGTFQDKQLWTPEIRIDNE